MKTLGQLAAMKAIDSNLKSENRAVELSIARGEDFIHGDSGAVDSLGKGAEEMENTAAGDINIYAQDPKKDEALQAIKDLTDRINQLQQDRPSDPSPKNGLPWWAKTLIAVTAIAATGAGGYGAYRFWPSDTDTQFILKAGKTGVEPEKETPDE